MSRALAVTATVLLLAGCYRVEHPAVYACSPAEPMCPEGYRCNGTICTTGSTAPDLSSDQRRDRVALDSPTPQEGPRPDQPKPDRPPAGENKPAQDKQDPCALPANWHCAGDLLHGTSTCGNRSVICDFGVPWSCTCTVAGSVNGCPPLSGAFINACAACAEALQQGCCRP